MLHFKMPNGEIETVEANEGDDIVDVSWEYDLDIEGKQRTSSTNQIHHHRLASPPAQRPRPTC